MSVTMMIIRIYLKIMVSYSIGCCSYVVTGTPITVEANQVALTPGHEIVLQCNLTDYPKQEFTWHRVRLSPHSHSYTMSSNRQHFYRQNQFPPQQPRHNLIQNQPMPEEQMISKEDRYIVDNNVLILKYPNYHDVGDYFCRVKNPSDEMEREKKIMVRARPYILDFDLQSSTYKSAVVDVGETLKIICNVVDDFEPVDNLSLKWTLYRFEEDPPEDIIDGEQGIRIEAYNSTSQALIIDKVDKSHRKFFKCQAYNGITDNSKAIFIRVRDKYTLIWPSLGILCEFAILIIIICIVENRRVEPDKDVYDHKAAHM